MGIGEKERVNRRYEKAFIAKLSDAEGEVAETQVWLQFALKFGYITSINYDKLYEQYNFILGKLVIMIRNPNKWSIIPKALVKRRRDEGERLNLAYNR